MTIKTAIGKLGKAVGSGFTPRANLPRSDVQSAVEYVMDNAANVGTVYAPTDAQYLTSASSSGLSNERVVGDSSTIIWDFTGLGTATASLQHLGIEGLSDPNADRGMFWDDSAGAMAWFTPANGLDFVGTNLSITDADLHYIINTTFSAGDFLYHDGTTLQRLGAGTDGQFLRTRGSSGTPPDWQNISGGGDMLRANNLSELENKATSRSNLGVAIGSDVQAYDATLQSLSALGTVADRIAYTTALDTWAEATLTAFARSILDDADEATFKATVNLEIGTDVQAYDATLASLSALGTAADKIAYTTGIDTWAETALTAFARSILDDADEATFKATVNLEIGTDVQAYDATLASLSALGTAADKLAYTTGIDTWAETALTAFGRSLIDDADAATARTTLGVVIGTDVQAYDAGLADIAALAVTDGNIIVGNGTNWVAESGATARTSLGLGTGDSPTFTAVTVGNAGLTVGTSVPFSDATGVLTLQNIDALDATTEATIEAAIDTLGNLTSIQGVSFTMGAYAPTILNTANEAGFKAAVNLEIGVDVQAYDAELAAIASLTSAADKVPYFTGSGTAAVADFTAAGRSMVAAATATAQTALLDAFTGDAGAGGVKGLVPAPAAGDAAAAKFLKADGSWTAPAGSGDMLAANNLSDVANASTSRLNLGVSPGQPQGRLTLTTATPVLTSTVSGATTIYYSPYHGQHVPLYDGTRWKMHDIGGELSQATTDATKSPAACTTNSNYDLFVWNDSGTYRCTRGPAWSSDTARGTGAGTTELEYVNGILVNKVAITNGPGAQRGTYVGTIRTNGSSQVDWIYGAVGVGGTAGVHGVWNCYNRRLVTSVPRDSTNSWTYNSTSWRSANSSTSMRVSLIIGLQEDAFRAEYAIIATSPAVTASLAGVGLDSTTAFSGMSGYVGSPSADSYTGSAVAIYSALTAAGFHYFQALEAVTNTNTVTFYGDGNSPSILQTGLVVTWMA